MTCGERYEWRIDSDPGITRFAVKAGCELADGTHPTGLHAGRIAAQAGYTIDLTGLVVRWPQSTAVVE